jgi:hypothetical protein
MHADICIHCKREFDPIVDPNVHPIYRVFCQACADKASFGDPEILSKYDMLSYSLGLEDLD